MEKNKGIIDINGANRHTMTKSDLNALYRSIDNFIADCTFEEVKRFESDIIGLKTLIHQRMQEA